MKFFATISAFALMLSVGACSGMKKDKDMNKQQQTDDSSMSGTGTENQTEDQQNTTSP